METIRTVGVAQAIMNNLWTIMETISGPFMANQSRRVFLGLLVME